MSNHRSNNNSSSSNNRVRNRDNDDDSNINQSNKSRKLTNSHSNSSSSKNNNSANNNNNNSTATTTAAAATTTIDPNRTLSFDALNLRPDLLRGLYSYGIDKPSAIQQRAIIPILKGRDVIAQSQSGTGKTTVFCIGALEAVNSNSPTIQVLILSPTRELAIQSSKVLSAFSSYMTVKIHACIGGKSIGEDIRALQSGVQIISGTPGRVCDMINRQQLQCKTIKLLIIDEADEILSSGFKEQLYEIYRYLPASIQLILTSATLPSTVLELTNKLMSNPVKILVPKDELSLLGISQYYIAVESEQWKFDTLIDLYNSLTISQSVIFCNTKSKVDWLLTKLKQAHFTVSALHGAMEQKDRDTVMNEFRTGSSRVLITTDVWGRGIDVAQISLVINYDLPNSKEFYIHRIGRSGRFGRKGLAINLVRIEDTDALRSIESFYNIVIPEMPANIAQLLE